ncbi:MAG: hypothetical protein ACXW04_09960 [Methylobacter sp.]
MKKIIFLVGTLISIHAFAFNVTISTKSDGSDKPTIIGTTNLPDGIELMATISRKSSSYVAQAKGTVKDGKFQMGPFSQDDAGLNPGEYIIEISMAVASLQPPVTWPIIGNQGSKLEGPLVEKDEIFGNTVEYKSKFKVGTGTSPQEDKESTIQAIKDRHQWWLNSCKQTCELVQGIALKRGEKFEWDTCYYKCVADEPNN